MPADLQENALAEFPTLERKPGKQNWVDKAGGLPQLIDRVARHLHYEKGRTIGAAIATAVNWAKKMCATGTAFGGKVKVGTTAKAAACKAVAEWEAKKAKSKAKSLAEAAGEVPELTAEEAGEFAAILQRRLVLVEGFLIPLNRPGANTGLVEGAMELLESADGEPVKMQLGGAHVSHAQTRDLRRSLSVERAALRNLIECLGGELAEAKTKDPVEDAEARVEKAKSKGPRDRRAGLTLKRGANGQRVNQAQERLSDLGYDVTQDGDFGPQTENAVKSFQGDHNLKVDGVLGSNTRIAMRGSSPEDVAERRSKAQSPNGDSGGESGGPRVDGDEAASETPEDEADQAGGDEAPSGQAFDWLTKGRGVGDKADPKVKAAQDALTSMGTFVGDKGSDGRFGPETEKAVKRVQRRYGLVSDGLVGPKTWSLLKRHTGEELEEAVLRYKADLSPIAKKAKADTKTKPSKTPKGRKGQAVEDPEFEKKHPRTPKGRTGGGEFLRKGSSGPAVKGVQRRLGVHRSGEYDQRTSKAVMNFQRSHGLTVDGIVGAQTAAALRGDSSPPSPGPLAKGDMRSLRHGRGGGGSGSGSSGGSSGSSSSGSSGTSSKSGSGTSSKSTKSSSAKSGSTGSSGSSSTGSSSGTSTSGGSSSGSGGTSSSSGSSSTPDLLRGGATGSEVNKLQRLLGLTPTGTYGKKTVQAVKRYQREHGLQVDGIVGAQTLSSLLGKSASPPGKLTPQLVKSLDNYKPKAPKVASKKKAKASKESSSAEGSPKPKPNLGKQRSLMEARLAEAITDLYRKDDVKEIEETPAEETPAEETDLQEAYGTGRLAGLEPGDTYQHEDGPAVVRTASGYMLLPPDGEPELYVEPIDVAERIAEIQAPDADTAKANLEAAARQLGDGWTPENLASAMSGLQGVTLDPAVETPGTICAVVKAAQLTPSADDDAAAEADEGKPNDLILSRDGEDLTLVDRDSGEPVDVSNAGARIIRLVLEEALADDEQAKDEPKGGEAAAADGNDRT